MASCILSQNVEQTVILLDIPRSIELAQRFEDEGSSKRLVSLKPAQQPYPSIEPKSVKALAKVEAIQISDLLLHHHIHLALDEVKTIHKGPFCYSRVLEEEMSLNLSLNRKRRALDDSKNEIHPESGETPAVHPTTELDKGSNRECSLSSFPNQILGAFCRNTENITQLFSTGSLASHTYIPPFSSYVNGSVEDTWNAFDQIAPRFNLVIMDPPWPNRSARRKQAYRLSYGTPEISALLSLIPLTSHLTERALVGVWVTNKPAFRDLLLGPNGFFEKWGLELVEEWVWVKVTASGEPICALDGTWRKPYEILLLGRSISGTETSEIKRRIIAGVPDLHSRKPNLRQLFKPMLPSTYDALEIFARNLTAGWWAWGNEVLKFQHEQHWLEIERKP